MTDNPPPTSLPTCCLCGLLCPLPMKWPDHDEPPACHRLHNWLSSQDTLHVKYFSDTTPERTQRRLESSAALGLQLQTVVRRLQVARRPLLWLESVDTETARAAVELAQLLEATLQVAQSPGAHHVARMIGTDGTLGTSLAEMRSNATLVVHIGQTHLRNMPMLEPRFLGAPEQIFLGVCPAEFADGSLAVAPDVVSSLDWPRDAWLDGLSRTLLAIRDDSAAIHRPAGPLDASAAQLAEALLASRYTVIVFDEEEFSDAVDQLVIARLRELAEAVSGLTRCSLLPLAQDAGRVTAKDTVLWLTNRAAPVCWRGSQWSSADVPSSSTLDQWRSAYDWIGCVRSLPSDRPLPELDFDLTIDANCNRTARDEAGSGVPIESAVDAERETAVRISVAGVGLNASGHLTRGDHGLAAYVRSLEDSSSRARDDYPLAASVLRQLASALASTAVPQLANGKDA